MLHQSTFQKWLDLLNSQDPELFKELRSRLDERVASPEIMASSRGIPLEAAQRLSPIARRAAALETIVREGRPAIAILENRISFTGAIVDAAAETIVKRLKRAAPTVEPCIQLVGRIDVDNHPTSLTYVGTGWLVDHNVVITNRHVAELIARSDNGNFRFRPGRFGETLRVSFDCRHEMGVDATDAVRVARVIWIERESNGPDVAFLELEQRTDGTRKQFIPLAESDAQANTEVVVIGYPARAPAHVIPDQAWMDRIYGGAYDVKRIAPGLMGASSRGWATHDCTTLGGNSGSVVIDMNSGHAVALHFAGLYMLENYAVPVSTIRKYKTERPWQGESSRPLTITNNGASAVKIETRVEHGQVSVTIPLTLTLTLGTPQIGQDPATTAPAKQTDHAAPDIGAAARELYRQHRVEGVYSVWLGYEIHEGRLSNTQCLVVSAHPERLEQVRDAMPRTFDTYGVDVRPASIDELTEAAGLAEAVVTSISYNDEDRTGDRFSFDWIDEEMTVDLHVGPERSWTVLSKFLEGAKTQLISSMYEFHAAHIAQVIEQDLNDGASMTLVLARQSRDPRNNIIPAGDFDRSETFDRWEHIFNQRFDRIFVPLGANGLVALSYHIKVTVADGAKVWLSSGNWKKSSQPVIATADVDNPKVTSKAGNREWHVVIDNKKLAERFGNHIKEDFKQSRKLGGTLEGVEDEMLVDVPRAVRESVELEAAPTKVLKPLRISRKVRVKPLLTPDQKGAVFSEAVLEHIRSAQKQLLFQNQYIKMNGANTGFFKELVDALVAKSRELPDFRIILRKENDSLAFDLSQLQRRGMDVNRHVRVLSKTHTKGIIVDGTRVLLGSHNWSLLGVTLNRDASMLFDDEEVAQYYAEAFELDWDRANEPRFDEAATETVRPAEGAEPPPGFVRMSLSEYLED